jgi:hypothetical protein
MPQAPLYFVTHTICLYEPYGYYCFFPHNRDVNRGFEYLKDFKLMKRIINYSTGGEIVFTPGL